MRKLIFILLATFIITPSINTTAYAVVVPAPVNTTEPSPEAVKAAVAAFKSLSRKEKKKRLKMLKHELATLKALKEQGYEADTNTILLVILAFILPPLAVYLHQGEINTKFWITLILWLLAFVAFIWLAWVPLLASIIYALIVILGNQ